MAHSGHVPLLFW